MTQRAVNTAPLMRRNFPQRSNHDRCFSFVFNDYTFTFRKAIIIKIINPHHDGNIMVERSGKNDSNRKNQLEK